MCVCGVYLYVIIFFVCRVLAHAWTLVRMCSLQGLTHDYFFYGCCKKHRVCSCAFCLFLSLIDNWLLLLFYGCCQQLVVVVVFVVVVVGFVVSVTGCFFLVMNEALIM